jgi:hypothetical protein
MTWPCDECGHACADEDLDRSEFSAGACGPRIWPAGQFTAEASARRSGGVLACCGTFARSRGRRRHAGCLSWLAISRRDRSVCCSRPTGTGVPGRIPGDASLAW